MPDGPRAFDESDAEEEGSEEDDGEDEDDEEEEGGGGAARRTAVAFAAADDYSVNLSDLLDDDDDDDDDVSDDESDDEGGGDGDAVVDLPAQMGGFVRALAAHVGEAGFAQLCAPLSEEERGAVGRSLPAEQGEDRVGNRVLARPLKHELSSRRSPSELMSALQRPSTPCGRRIY